MATVDPAKIVLLFTAPSESGLTSFSDNERYRLQLPARTDSRFWGDNQMKSSKRPVFGLSFGQYMYSPQGWVFGSAGDTDVCDFQLAGTKEMGVSAKHFRMDVEPQAGRPRITILSRNPVQIHVDNNKQSSKRKRTTILAQGDSLDIVQMVTIDLGTVTLLAWRPHLSGQDRDRYNRNAEEFHLDSLNAMPKLSLNIDHPGVSTLSMRFGEGGKCYKAVDSSESRTGSFASVLKVKEMHSGELFAAKMPHFRTNDLPSMSKERWENLEEERRKLSRVRHVCGVCESCFLGLTNNVQRHVVTAFEIILGMTTSDPPWLVMEWVEHDLATHRIVQDD